MQPLLLKPSALTKSHRLYRLLGLVLADMCPSPSHCSSKIREFFRAIHQLTSLPYPLGQHASFKNFISGHVLEKEEEDELVSMVDEVHFIILITSTCSWFRLLKTKIRTFFTNAVQRNKVNSMLSTNPWAKARPQLWELSALICAVSLLIQQGHTTTPKTP